SASQRARVACAPRSAAGSRRTSPGRQVQMVLVLQWSRVVLEREAHLMHVVGNGECGAGQSLYGPRVNAWSDFAEQESGRCDLDHRKVGDHEGNAAMCGQRGVELH